MRRPDRDPSYRLVATDAGDQVEAENRLVEALAGVATEARLNVDGPELAERTPDAARTLRERFDPVEGEDRPDGGNPDHRSFRIPLPEGTDAVGDVLSVETDSWAGEARWRLWDVRVVVLLDGDEVLYRSVPHERIHDLYADTLPAVVEPALSELPGVAVLPVPVVAWSADGREYELRPDRLDFRLVFPTGDDRSFRDLADADRVLRDPTRPDLLVDWVDPLGLGARLPSYLQPAPPERLVCPDRSTREAVLDELRGVVAALDLDVELPPPDRA